MSEWVGGWVSDAITQNAQRVLTHTSHNVKTWADCVIISPTHVVPLRWLPVTNNAVQTYTEQHRQVIASVKSKACNDLKMCIPGARGLGKVKLFACSRRCSLRCSRRSRLTTRVSAAAWNFISRRIVLASLAKPGEIGCWGGEDDDGDSMTPDDDDEVDSDEPDEDNDNEDGDSSSEDDVSTVNNVLGWSCANGVVEYDISRCRWADNDGT